jgi:hypothetical protein
MAQDVFDAEIAKPLGMEGHDARARLGRGGLIQGKQEGAEMRSAIKGKRIPGIGQTRLMVATPAAMEDNTGVQSGGGAALGRPAAGMRCTLAEWFPDGIPPAANRYNVRSKRLIELVGAAGFEPTTPSPPD